MKNFERYSGCPIKRCPTEHPADMTFCVLLPYCCIFLVLFLRKIPDSYGHGLELGDVTLYIV
jgi:hypothetical protein